ncbi:MAG: hypothetical protein A2234_09465 [Elusimicrobia bacterium RIFOXYA2_FULL_58_8]|nr:MAG: hypothetical protein A2285_09040 [Elusimicrobia bacterium RIFOXYA12_FULL_57_11]OGS13453.1 MAG: hypothetical protein A2234_09465 [Elusimicrobia bacterium RIFOXYA2_FULL_58_8]
MSSKKLLTLLTILAAMPLNALAGQAAAPRPAAPNNANRIAFSFYARAAQTPGNLFFSPYSINTAFAMTHQGANGNTAAEIEKVFGFEKDKAAGRAAFGALTQTLAAAAKGAEFAQANSFWAQQDYAFLPAYIKVLNANYGAEARAADFKTDAEGARKTLNAWTEKKTKGKIKDLFPQDSLNALTRLVLINAVYFKGKWETAFAKARTFDADFTLNSGDKIKTPLMTLAKTGELEYGEAPGLQLLRLPYKGGSLALLAVLPQDQKTFAELEKDLTAEKLDSLRQTLARQPVKVFLPRFTFSSSFNLAGYLAALGMPEAFTDAANFSGMDGTKKLYIQKAVHKAFVEVNEEGTEAAAATGVAMGLKSMPFDQAVFRADRPFIFFIEDTKTGLLLFMGRVENPLNS